MIMKFTHGAVTASLSYDGDVTIQGGPEEVRLSADEVAAATIGSDPLGFCSSCGAETELHEVDAEGYDCGSCGSKGTVTSIGRILGLV